MCDMTLSCVQLHKFWATSQILGNFTNSVQIHEFWATSPIQVDASTHKRTPLFTFTATTLQPHCPRLVRNYPLQKKSAPCPSSSCAPQASHCKKSKHTALHCRTLSSSPPHQIHCSTLQHTATHCNTLHHTAPYCNTLHHTAQHCTTLQNAATHCNTTVRCHGDWSTSMFPAIAPLGTTTSSTTSPRHPRLPSLPPHPTFPALQLETRR